MEMGCIGFLLGVLVSIIFFGAGICVGSNDKGQSDNNNCDNVRLYIPSWYRGGMVGHDEKMIVLNTFRAEATAYEKKVIDEILKDLGDEQ